MTIDMHTHPAKFRCMDAAIDIAVDSGLGGFVSTDHYRAGPDCWRGYDYARMCGEPRGIVVLPGAEVTIRGCDYLIYGLTPATFPDLRHLDRCDMIRAVHSRGGVVVQAHPFRCRRRWRGCVDLAVDGYEVNGRDDDNANALALELADMLGLLVTHGSDTHRGTGLGTCVATLPHAVTTSEGLGDWLRSEGNV